MAHSPTWQELQKGQAASFGHILMACAAAMDTAGQARVNHEAGRILARPALMRLVPHLSPAGVRVTELARRLDVSKQAAHKAVLDLAEEGFVEVDVDPTDARARIVRLSRTGIEACAFGLSCLASIEEKLREEMGDSAIDSLTQGLSVVLKSLAKSNSLSDEVSLVGRRSKTPC